MLCGRASTLSLPAGTVTKRSLFIAFPSFRTRSVLVVAFLPVVVRVNELGLIMVSECAGWDTPAGALQSAANEASAAAPAQRVDRWTNLHRSCGLSPMRPASAFDPSLAARHYSLATNESITAGEWQSFISALPAAKSSARARLGLINA